MLVLLLIGCPGPVEKPEPEETGGHGADTAPPDGHDTSTDDTADTHTGTDTHDSGGETDTEVRDTGHTGVDSGDTDTGHVGRDTASDTGETGTPDTGDPDTGGGRDSTMDPGGGGRDTSGGTGDICDRDICDTAADTGADTGDTGDSKADTGEICDRDVCDTGGRGTADAGDTGGGTGDTADTADTGAAAAVATTWIIATYADWSAGTGRYSAWDWPSQTPIVADVALATRDNMVDCDSGTIFLNARNTGVADTITQMDVSGALGDTWTLEADANVWDVDWIDGSYWVSVHNGARIDLYDADGNVTETIDLSPYADSDGTSEPAGTTEIDGYTYVVLSGHDEPAGVYGTPQLLQLDTASRTVTWALSLSGSLASGLGHRVGSLVYMQDQGTLTYDARLGTVEPNLDGGFEIVDLDAASTSGFVLSEATENATFDAFFGIEGTGTGWLVMTDQASGTQTVELADLDAGTHATAFIVSGYDLVSLALDEDGTFWTLQSEVDSSGATVYAWVHRDATFVETERFSLGEDLFSLATCSF